MYEQLKQLAEILSYITVSKGASKHALYCKQAANCPRS